MNTFEDVLADALVAHDLEGIAGFQRVAAAHPEYTERLRAHLDRLRGFGLLQRDTRVAGEPAVGDTTTDKFPEQLGEFRLLQRLGGGGMGVVYLAEQGSLGRRVALKLVRSEHLYFQGAYERFRREVEAIAKLQHPGIVPVYTAGEDAGVPWLAMEHVVGASLDRVIAWLAGRDPARLRGSDLRSALTAVVASRPATGEDTVSSTSTELDTNDPASPFAGTWAEACLRLTRNVAIALQHAHERGVLHRDVKPSNIMLALDGRALLLDFGLATSHGSARLTGTGHQLGSPAYMSPEQMRGDHKRVDARTDVYALGVTLYELLTLRAPFVGESAASTRELVLAGRPAPMRVLNRSISRDADIVCRKAMDLDVGRRYASAAAFAKDLDNLLTQHPILARPPGPLRIALRWAQRSPATATAVVAAFLLLVVAPIVFLKQQQSAHEALMAQEQRALADTRRQRDHALEVVDSMLTRVASEALFEVPRMAKVRRDLLVQARSHYERFLAEAADDRQLRARAAAAATRLATVEVQLGSVDAAFAAVQRAEALLDTNAPPDAETRTHVRRLMMVKGACLQSRASLQEALTALERARTLCETTLAADANDADAWCDRIAIERALALVHRQLGQDDEALASTRRLLPLIETALAKTIDTEHHLATVDELLCAIAEAAEVYRERGDVDDLLEVLRHGEDVLQEVDEQELPSSARVSVAQMLLVRARVDVAAGRVDAAEPTFRKALASARDVLDDFPEYANGLRCHAAVANDLAMLLSRTERPQEATGLLDESIRTLRRLIAIDPGVVENRANLAASLVNVGSGLFDAGEMTKARDLFAEAVPLAHGALTAAPTRGGWRTIVHNAEWFLALASGKVGDHTTQAAAAERLAANQPDDARTLRIAAELLSQASDAIGKDASIAPGERDTRRQGLEAKAMTLLREAARLGCADREWLATSDEFAPLRKLPGFAEILQTVAENERRAGR